MFKLDKRLRALLNEIKGGVIADIGCDHGKLSIAAILERKCDKVIAADISANSLSKAIMLANSYALTDNIEFRVSNGFEKINENLDTAIIAGLGGYEIRDILLKSLSSVKRLLLCPHQNAMVARIALMDLDYGASKDFVVKEGDKYYQIIVAEKGVEKYTDNELRFGKNFPATQDYYSMLIDRKTLLDARFKGRVIPEGEMKDEYQEIERCLELKTL